MERKQIYQLRMDACISLMLNLSMLSACPPLQFYGENCSLPCPQGCQKGLCDSNGNCFSCIEGYKGLKCDQREYQIQCFWKYLGAFP